MVEVVELSTVEECVLDALAIYRYLTPAQMMRLGVTRDKRHLYAVLARLLAAGRKPKEIGELDFGVVVGKGRLPRLYYLTKQGAELLEGARKELEAVDYVRRPTKFNQDYWHRVFTVDCHIALRQFAEREGHRVRFFKTYFEHARQNTAATRIPLQPGAIVPDALFLLDCVDGHARLFALEVANGNDTGRIERQIDRYVEAIEQDAIEDAVGVETAARVIFVFEHERTLDLVAARLAGNGRARAYCEYFFCKTLGDVRGDLFRANWHRLNQGTAPTVLFGA